VSVNHKIISCHKLQFSRVTLYIQIY